MRGDAWITHELRPDAGARWAVGGQWILDNYAELAERVAGTTAGLSAQSLNADHFEWDSVSRLDTAGASLLVDLLGVEQARRLANAHRAKRPDYCALLDTMAQAEERSGRAQVPAKRDPLSDALVSLGASVARGWTLCKELLAFFGMILESIAGLAFQPRRWRITAVVAEIQRVAVDAIPIVALLSFMVGMVVAFLGASVLANFGASIFSVHLVAFAFMREFGVLLPAILVAGRTASAFTAQIGAMKANEEIDALRTGGLNPLEILVVPRVLALLVSLPVLTFVGIISGIVGGAVVCVVTLDISVAQFLSIMHDKVEARHFLVGLSKSPFFAVVIAVIGCFEGFKASGSAQSVGEHTTSSVVQSIFAVIVLDAFAALFFMEMGW